MNLRRLAHIERINVVGTSGSGKTTFGRALARALDLPFIELDSIHWQPGWRGLPDAQFFPAVEAATGPTRWVLDGNYARTTPLKWRHVQLVVWLDMPFWRTLFRVTSRSIRRAIRDDELWPGTGNVESWRQSFFSRDSVILWSIQTYRRKRVRYSRAMTDPRYAHIWFVRLRSPRTVRAFLATAHKAGGMARRPARES